MKAKAKAKQKLLKAVEEVADILTDGKIGWFGKEAVESAIMEYLADHVKRRQYHGLLDLDDYLPTSTERG